LYAEQDRKGESKNTQYFRYKREMENLNYLMQVWNDFPWFGGRFSALDFAEFTAFSEDLQETEQTCCFENGGGRRRGMERRG